MLDEPVFANAWPGKDLSHFFALSLKSAKDYKRHTFRMHSRFDECATQRLRGRYCSNFQAGLEMEASVCVRSSACTREASSNEPNGLLEDYSIAPARTPCCRGFVLKEADVRIGRGGEAGKSKPILAPIDSCSSTVKTSNLERARMIQRNPARSV